MSKKINNFSFKIDENNNHEEKKENNKKAADEESKKEDDDDYKLIQNQIENLNIGKQDNDPLDALKLFDVDFPVNRLVEGLKNKNFKNIVFMTGAGISVSAGIPDFRTPETGLYARLGSLKLPYAEAVFDIKYFQADPKPFYAASKEIFGYQAKPVISHFFQRLVQDNDMLRMIFTQNIDGLEIDAGK